MAKIATYSVDAVVSEDDMLIGSDAENSDQTKNFKVGDLKKLHTEFLVYEFKANGAAVQELMLIMKAPFPMIIQSVVMQSDDTMDDIAVEINGAPVIPLDAIDVTTTITEVVATSDNNVPADGVVMVITSGIAGSPTFLRVQLNYKRA